MFIQADSGLFLHTWRPMCCTQKVHVLLMRKFAGPQSKLTSYIFSIVVWCPQSISNFLFLSVSLSFSHTHTTHTHTHFFSLWMWPTQFEEDVSRPWAHTGSPQPKCQDLLHLCNDFNTSWTDRRLVAGRQTFASRSFNSDWMSSMSLCD